MSRGKLLLGVLAGLAAGAVIGILLAPDKGSETRKKVAGYGKDLADELGDSFHKWVSSVAEKVEHVAHEAREKAQQGSDEPTA